jgi:DUF917 family protein
MGRALPDLDQISLLVDALPGLVAATPTGAGGVALVHGARPEDVEKVLRTATSCNGGWAGFALGGFRVGDLAAHSIPDGIERALRLGRAIAAADDLRPQELATALGGTLLGAGRVVASIEEPGGQGVRTYDVRTDSGDVLRLVARSEFIALVRNGAVDAASPTIITVLDTLSRAALQVDELAVGKDVIIVELAAAMWWASDPVRLARARPSRWGIAGLEEVS